MFKRKTLKNISAEEKRSVNWVRKQLNKAAVVNQKATPIPIILIMDATYWGRKFGYLVAYTPTLKKVVYFKRIFWETKELYQNARTAIEREGYTILAVILDGRKGVKEVFADKPVQLCHFHQKQIMVRYLTKHPKLEAAQELKRIVNFVGVFDENAMMRMLGCWYDHWQSFIKERTKVSDSNTWFYTHKRLRAAYRSLSTNLPFLYTYQKNPELCLPTTTNELDGSFAYLKELVSVHRGCNLARKYKYIETILSR